MCLEINKRAQLLWEPHGSARVRCRGRWFTNACLGIMTKHKGEIQRGQGRLPWGQGYGIPVHQRSAN